MALLTWLESSGLGTWVREASSIFAFPMILTLHTIGLGLLAGSSAVVDIRLLGIGGRVPLAPMRSLFRVMWAGFWLNLLTGSLLFAAQASVRGTSLFFLAKMTMVAVGVLTMVLLQREVLGIAPPARTATASRTRVLAVASLVAWTAAITAGRLLAYV
jgi:hypothetical protein